MISSQLVEKDVLIDTLIAMQTSPGVYPLRTFLALEGAPTQYKTFWEHVPDDVEMPYLVVSHIMGGRGQGSRSQQAYTDSVWKVVIYTADMTAAQTVATLVDLLQDACPLCSRYTGVSPVTTLQSTMPVFDRKQVQNVPIFAVGGLYRIRLNLGEN
jgi:hypothetical protein